MEQKNYYQILGVQSNASNEEIRKAYLKKIKEFHPDKFQGNTHLAEKLTANLNIAYTTLKDELLRKEYDKKININTFSKNNTTKNYNKSNSQQSTNSNFNNFTSNNQNKYTNKAKEDSSTEYKKVNTVNMNSLQENKGKKNNNIREKFILDVIIIILLIVAILLIIFK